MGKSLTFRGAVYEAQDILKHHRCRDPICDTHLWKVRHELDMARLRIRQLEKDLEVHGIKPSQAKYASHICFLLNPILWLKVLNLIVYQNAPWFPTLFLSLTHSLTLSLSLSFYTYIDI